MVMPPQTSTLHHRWFVPIWLVLLAAVATSGHSDDEDLFDDDRDLDEVMPYQPSFRMDDMQDLLEMQYLVEFVDEERGVCPTVTPAELFFDQNLIEQEYGAERLGELQELYKESLPDLKEAWVQHNGEVRLALLEDKESGGQHHHPTIGLQEDSRADTAFPIDEGQQQETTIDLASLFNLNGGGDQLGDISHLLQGLKIVINGQEIHVSDGANQFLDQGVVHQGANGVGEPFVVDLNKILLDKERKKYLSESQAGRTDAARGASHSEPIDGNPHADQARHLEDTSAILEYEAANNAWISSKPHRSTPVRTTRRMSSAKRKLLNVLAALEHSCEVADLANPWQCTADAVQVLDSINDSLRSVHPDFKRELQLRIGGLQELIDKRMNDRQRQQEVETYCNAVIGRVDNGPRVRRSGTAAALDTLVPAVSKLVGGDGDEKLSDESADRLLDSLSSFIEHHGLDRCASTASSSAPSPANRRAWWYAASLLRHSVPFSQMFSVAVNGPLSLLDMLQAHGEGSANARFALATMHEFGVVAEKDCWAATGHISNLAVLAHDKLFDALELVYSNSIVTRDSEGGSRVFDRRTLEVLRDARAHIRSNGIDYNLFTEDTLEDTRLTVEEAVAALKDRFMSSRSTYASFTLIKTLIPLFWGSLRYDVHPTGRQDHADEQHIAVHVNCWTWLVAARFVPEVVERFMVDVSAKCSSVDDGVILAAIEGGLYEHASSVTDHMKRNVERSADVQWFNTATISLTMLALQELLLPCGPEAHCSTMRRDVVLQRSAELLASVMRLAEAVHHDGSIAAEKLIKHLGVDGQRSSSLFDDSPWHASLCLLGRLKPASDLDDLSGNAGDDHHSTKAADMFLPQSMSGVISSGFVRPEWFLLDGLVHRMMGDEGSLVIAAHRWMQGAALELEPDNDESAMRLLFLRSQSSPVDGTSSGRRGDCLYLLARLVRDNEVLFGTLQQQHIEGAFVMDIPDLSVFHHTSSRAYANALINAAAAHPLFHIPSIATKLHERWQRNVLFNDNPHRSDLLEHSEHECDALLADLRNVQLAAHEKRSLQMFQWITDRVVFHNVPKTWLERVGQLALDVLCGIGEKISVFHCRNWEVDTTIAGDDLDETRSRTVQHLIRQLGTNGGGGRAEDGKAMDYWLDLFTAVESAHFWLQQGSAEVVSSLLSMDDALSIRFRQIDAAKARLQSRVHKVRDDLALVMSRFGRLLSSEQAALYRMHGVWNGSARSRRLSLAGGTPFQFIAGERRIEAVNMALYARGMQSFQVGCLQLHGSVVGGEAAWHCSAPDAGVLGIASARRQEYQQVVSKCLSEGASSPRSSIAQQLDSAHSALWRSMSSFAQCSGPALSKWFTSSDATEIWTSKTSDDPHFLLPIWSDDDSLLATKPRCAIYLALMLLDYFYPSGDHPVGHIPVCIRVDESDGCIVTLPHDAFPRSTSSSKVARVAQEILSIAIASAQRLRVFHRYDGRGSPDLEDDNDEVNEGDTDDTEFDAANANEDDPNDERLETATLAKLYRQSKRQNKSFGREARVPYSANPVAPMDPNGIRPLGDGHWLSTRRSEIASAWYSATMMKAILAQM